ncbi:hypothetical protein PVOR_02251 [Paenibacillus vortex V453]|uniref:Uncharacterized protein n=1 Tax=Paenibacillus vortex V453 TaxID=715225 RepID=A0A2R9T1R3_9BACL|nr:hypothetical protein PVOR_02251 [Paenibacillus vortex V453]
MRLKKVFSEMQAILQSFTGPSKVFKIIIKA